MKISIDLDGTLYSRMAFFRELMLAMQSRGHKVGILTGHGQDSEAHDVRRLMEAGFPKPDFYFGRTPEYMPLNGAHYKSMVIRREGITLHFDDYDFDNQDTARIFAELGDEVHIARMKAREPVKDGSGKTIRYE